MTGGVGLQRQVRSGLALPIHVVVALQANGRRRIAIVMNGGRFSVGVSTPFLHGETDFTGKAPGSFAIERDEGTGHDVVVIHASLKIVNGVEFHDWEGVVLVPIRFDAFAVREGFRHEDEDSFTRAGLTVPRILDCVPVDFGLPVAPMGPYRF